VKQIRDIPGAHGKVFVMLVGDELVVKLPERRCAEIVAGGEGRHLDRGKRLVRSANGSRSAPSTRTVG